MKFDFSIYVTYGPVLIRGLLLTIAASGIAIVLSPILGAGLALARLSRYRIAVGFAMAFIEAMRDLPFMVVLFLTFYLLPALGIRLPAFAVGVITLSLYSGAYFAEIMRSTILAVPKGQMESARATGMSRLQALRHVIAPQMMGYFLPPATNQAVLVVKESSILSTITVAELTMASEVIQSYTYSPIEVFALISILYWLLCSSVTRIGRKLEDTLRIRGRRAGRAV
jgi:His/Glu/Gln/Arg/opine family amino acid ABC transporter permease subunit